MKIGARVALWIAALPIIAIVAFWMGEDHYQDEAGDMAPVGGLGWTFVASLVYVVVICSVESVLLARRKRREHELDRIRRGLPPRRA